MPLMRWERVLQEIEIRETENNKESKVAETTEQQVARIMADDRIRKAQ